MTVVQSAQLRGVVGVSLAIATAVAWRVAPRLRMSAQRFFQLALGAFALSRLGIFMLAFGVLHLVPHGDINLYMEEAAPALAGKLVYRDFLTPHAPLDPYLLSSMLRLHNSPLTIMLFAVLFDICALYLWMKAAPHFLSALTFRRTVLLMLFNPTSLLTEAIDGQMNSFIALFLALAVYLLVRNRNFLSGAAVAVPTAVIKFLTLIFAPGFLFAVADARRRLIATAGFVAVILLVYIPFALAGANLLVPLTAEGNHVTSSNFPFLFEMLTGRSLGLRLPDLILAASWFLVVAVTFFAMRRASTSSEPDRRQTFYLLTLSLIAELLCIQAFSKNTWDRYLVMTMFPLCLLAAEFTFSQILAYCAWLAVIVVEPSFWSAVLLMVPAGDAHAALLAHNPRFIALLLVELIVVLGNLALLLACLRRLLASRASAPGALSTQPPTAGYPLSARPAVTAPAG